MSTNFNPWRGSEIGLQALGDAYEYRNRQRTLKRQEDVQQKQLDLDTQRQNIWAKSQEASLKGQTQENDMRQTGMDRIKKISEVMAQPLQPGETFEGRYYKAIQQIDPEKAPAIKSHFLGEAVQRMQLEGIEKGVKFYNDVTGENIQPQGDPVEWSETVTGKESQPMVNPITGNPLAPGQYKMKGRFTNDQAKPLKILSVVPEDTKFAPAGSQPMSGGVTVGEKIPEKTPTAGTGRTIEKMGPDGKIHIYQFNPSTNDYDKDLGLAPPKSDSGAAAAERSDQRQNKSIKSRADYTKDSQLKQAEDDFTRGLKDLNSQMSYKLLTPETRKTNANYQAEYSELVRRLIKAKTDAESLWRNSYMDAGYDPGPPVDYSAKETPGSALATNKPKVGTWAGMADKYLNPKK